MFAQQRKNRRKVAKSVGDRYLTRTERKYMEWLNNPKMKSDLTTKPIKN
jgi:hypothetical protein